MATWEGYWVDKDEAFEWTISDFRCAEGMVLG